MGNKILGTDIAGILNRNLGPIAPLMTLVKVTSGTRSATEPSAGTLPTESPAPCRGFLDSYRDSQYDDTLILRGDRKAVILGDSLPSGVAPEPGDVVEAESRRFRVVAVDRDPDAATYLCQLRGK